MKTEDWLPGANWSQAYAPKPRNADRYVMAACLAALAFLVVGVQKGWF